MKLGDEEGQLTCKRADPRSDGRRVALHSWCLCMDPLQDCSPESAAPVLLLGPSWCRSQRAKAGGDDLTLSDRQGRLAGRGNTRLDKRTGEKCVYTDLKRYDL